MVLTKRKSQMLINKFKNLNINQQVQMSAPVVEYFLRTFDGNINPGNIKGDKNVYLINKGDIQGS